MSVSSLLFLDVTVYQRYLEESYACTEHVHVTACSRKSGNVEIVSVQGIGMSYSILYERCDHPGSSLLPSEGQKGDPGWNPNGN